MATKRQRQIVLLRGINVGGHRRVAMADLRALLNRLGYEDVQALLQSGNVVLTSGVRADRLERQLEEQLEDEFGLDIQVVVRTRNELADVIERNPLAAVANDPARHVVSFLSAAPAASVVRELAGIDVPPEQFVVSGRELYVWHPNGINKSQLMKLLSEKRLGVTATARNWNTLTKLLALADA